MSRPTCAVCGQPVKPMRGVPGAWMHASRTVAACDLDGDHIPRPADEPGDAPDGGQPTRGQADTSG